MLGETNDKIFQDGEPLRARMTYAQRKEMQRQYVKKYDDSQLGQNRNPFARARAVQPVPEGQKRSRFDALIRRRGGR